MPDTRLPQPADSGHAQLSLFGAGEPQNTLPAANAPLGPYAPEAALSRVDIDAPGGLASESSATQPPVPPPLALPSTPATVLSGQSAECTAVATAEAGQLETSVNACILSNTVSLVVQDAGVTPQPLRFTIDSLYYLLEEIGRIRDRIASERGGTHVKAGAPELSPPGPEPEPGEALGRSSVGCQASGSPSVGPVGGTEVLGP